MGKDNTICRVLWKWSKRGAPWLTHAHLLCFWEHRLHLLHLHISRAQCILVHGLLGMNVNWMWEDSQSTLPPTVTMCWHILGHGMFACLQHRQPRGAFPAHEVGLSSRDSAGSVLCHPSVDSVLWLWSFFFPCRSVGDMCLINWYHLVRQAKQDLALRVQLAPPLVLLEGLLSRLTDRCVSLWQGGIRGPRNKCAVPRTPSEMGPERRAGSAKSKRKRAADRGHLPCDPPGNWHSLPPLIYHEKLLPFSH